jgi:hypothetical protein
MRIQLVSLALAASVFCAGAAPAAGVPAAV